MNLLNELRLKLIMSQVQDVRCKMRFVWLVNLFRCLILLVKNEFYISQVYNEYILDNKKIIHYPIPEIFSINTPTELENNKNNILNFLKKH